MKLDESIKRMELREQLIGIAMLKEGEYEDYFTELEMYRGLNTTELFLHPYVMEAPSILTYLTTLCAGLMDAEILSLDGWEG